MGVPLIGGDLIPQEWDLSTKGFEAFEPGEFEMMAAELSCLQLFKKNLVNRWAACHI